MLMQVVKFVALLTFTSIFPASANAGQRVFSAFVQGGRDRGLVQKIMSNGQKNLCLSVLCVCVCK